MGTGSGATGPSKSERRARARETAKRMREEAARRSKRRLLVIQGSAILGIVAVLAVVGLIIALGVGTPATTAAPRNMASGGVLFQNSTSPVVTPAMNAGGSKTKMKRDGRTAHIQIWLDFQCPACQRFERLNAEQMTTWLKEGSATVEIHPIAIRDATNNDNYSTRSAAAAVCVADAEPAKFLDITTALYANQPDEATGSGLTNAELLRVFADAGVRSRGVAECVKEQRFASFVTDLTQQAAAEKQLRDPQRDGLSTPAVFVDGRRYAMTAGADAAHFAAFVKSVVADGSGSETITFPRSK